MQNLENIVDTALPPPFLDYFGEDCGKNNGNGKIRRAEVVASHPFRKERGMDGAPERCR